MFYKYAALIFFIALSFSSRAQEKQKKGALGVGMTNFSFGYGLEFPHGDLSDRFGRNFKFTVGAERITASNWIYGLEFSFMFGDTVKEDVVSNLRLSNGNILGADNSYAEVFQRQRGVFFGANFGKLIPFKSNSRSGIRITGALGLFAHYVRVQDEVQSLPQIEGEYIKGYDRLTRGLALREFIGYHHISQDTRLNFYIGIEFTQGFTSNVRDVNFNTGLPANKDRRFDGLVGLKAAIILPFYGDYEDEEIFY
ncbi:MAG: hypothetical protein AAGA77_24080 [Bacteroidota bacterium]